jgi:hypothetical protein
MARHRYIQINGELVEVSPDYVPEPNRLKGDAALWNDRTYQDAGDTRFKSRKQHREFMKRHNLTTADDFSNMWRETEKMRVAVKNGYDPTRKQDIVKAIQQLTNGKRC